MSFVGHIGGGTMVRLEEFGDFCRFSGQSWRWLFAGSLRWRNLKLLFPQFYEVATRSIPVVMITGAFIGMVLAVHVVNQFKAINMEAKMGSVVNLSVLAELGPVLAGVMLAGRVGGAFTAELGTMRVTEQIDALRAMGADPLRVLVIPRFLACVLMIPVLVLYASFMGILGGYLIAVNVYSVNGAAYWRESSYAITYFDIFQGPIKSMFFGAVLSLICCFKGFRCAAGAAGVGRACTEAFVASCMAILALDFFVGMVLNTLSNFFYGVKTVF
ncbi:MAG: MlaE family ABC transporter permease [Phycisphaerae bacterium]